MLDGVLQCSSGGGRGTHFSDAQTRTFQSGVTGTVMDALFLSKQVEQRYRQYLQTTFYFRDPELRASFQATLDAGHVRKGPYLEATPVFRRGGNPRSLFTTLLGKNLDEGFLSALKADRSLYLHQEESIKNVSADRNVVVATGTGSGKTESFLYPFCSIST